jgi:protein SCO1
MNQFAMTLRYPVLIATAFALSLSGCGANAPAEPPPLAGSKISGDFALTDKAGKMWRSQDFAGKYRVVYFGYTFCPDVCPLDMAVVVQGLNRFAKAEPKLADQVQPIFITIDPARDTPSVVGEFAAAFSPKLLGLTGTAAQIDQAAKAFLVYYNVGKETSGGYLMDHSRYVYLMGREGQPIAMLPVDQGADAVTAELTKWVK